MDISNMDQSTERLRIEINPSTSTLFVGLALSFPIVVMMPCGNRLRIESMRDMPQSDMPCPCGNPNHWVVRFFNHPQEIKDDTG